MQELIPYLKFTLIMVDIYILCRIFSREVVRLDRGEGWGNYKIPIFYKR